MEGRDETLQRIADRLNELRRWIAVVQPSSIRVVQYLGVEIVAAWDTQAAELEWQVEGGLGEGYDIDWTEHEGKAYLRWWEGDPEPAWPKVFAEEHLADMTAIEAEIAEAVRKHDLRAT